MLMSHRANDLCRNDERDPFPFPQKRLNNSCVFFKCLSSTGIAESMLMLRNSQSCLPTTHDGSMINVCKVK